MKKSLFAVAVLASVAAAPAVSAADGTINFVGEITDVACTVDTNSQNLTVTLGRVASTAFTGAGSTAAPTQFQLILRDCPVSANSAVVKFDGTSVEGDNSMLALATGVNAATGVAIQLTDASQQIVKLYENSARYDLLPDVDNNLDFIARYKAISETVTAGVANATTQFTIIYQ
jgi:major type 1 subunit fimbrin (pilin)